MTKCKNKEMGEYACSDKTQCWEPCGDLGKSEEHAAAYNPRIVCAANRDTLSGDIILGIRHWDVSMRIAYNNWEIVNNHVTRDVRFKEQGFIDQYGNFYDRTEAWKIAEKNDQIIKRCGGDTTNGGTLYSENLY